jgi:hypothetical protein
MAGNALLISIINMSNKPCQCRKSDYWVDNIDNKEYPYSMIYLKNNNTTPYTRTNNSTTSCTVRSDNNTTPYTRQTDNTISYIYQPEHKATPYTRGTEKNDTPYIRRIF